MTGNRAVSAELDENIAGSVRFGDNSVVQIRGRGTVAIAMHGDEHRALTAVYYIPRLKTSIISLGQLDENGYLSSIRGGYMSLWDHNNRLLAKVPCSPNRLYQITLQVAQPLCMAARSGGHAWLWHERLGHQNFAALWTMSRNSMVWGLPEIKHVDQLWDTCLIGKQRRAPFPLVARFWATARLELVHTYL
jgi:hypothetical protein